MRKKPFDPDLHIRFAADFSVVEAEGEIDDPSRFGVTLLTALRSADQGAHPLQLGKVKALRGRDESHGFSLQIDESGHNLRRFPGVVRWAEVDSSSPSNRAGFPVIPSPEDIPAWLDKLSSLRWRGVRTQSDDAWQHRFRDHSLNEDSVVAFGTSVLQLDLLLRSLRLPRRELQVVFDQAGLRLAVNGDRDFLFVLSASPIPTDEQLVLNRCMDFFAWPV